MKAVVLAGGLGTRLGEESLLTPKPMIEIGGKPILWHIMKLYAHHGIREFVICHGYKGYVIKEFFANYLLHVSNVTFHGVTAKVDFHQPEKEPWTVTVVDTGEHTMTGGRIRRIRSYIDDGDFCMTYGDGVGDIDLSKLIAFHRDRKTLATVTAVRPPARFGALDISGDRVEGFQEHSVGESGWINGGFFVLSPKVLDYIAGDETFWELEPMARLVRDGQLSAYRHKGFWQPMDTPRDKMKLEELWSSGNAPWKVWP